MNTRNIITILLLFVAMTGQAQTEESSTQSEQMPTKRYRENLALGGVLMMLAPSPDYYDRNLERYNPPAPMIWVGSSWLNGGMMGDHQAEFPLRSGVFNKLDCGFTVFQVSRNLYRGTIGLSTALQVGGYSFDVKRGYIAEKDGRYVEFVPSDDEGKKKTLSYTTLRIPLLIGAQSNNRLFSLQTGLGLCYTNRPGAQWLVSAGLGPFTINYSQNLTPLFKMTDGTKAYPSSLSIGVDIWYWMCRFSRPE